MMAERAGLDESLWFLELNGRRVAQGTHTRGHAEALGAGRLTSIGAITRRADLLAITARLLQPGVTLIRAHVEPERAWLVEQERRHGVERGCGLLHAVWCDASAVRRDRCLAVPSPESFPSLFRELFDSASARYPDGGVHAAALTDGTTLVRQVEDVGRHNAVEKAIGLGLLDGLDLSALGVIVSARVSGQMAWSAARGGIAWIASRSVGTTLAAAVAAAAALPLIERAASPHARVSAGSAGGP
ncbi:MAG: formate dehydrogenase accessory sulfurtransferase FdhD [Gemmatimonadetes bacterium]|nr:formate dehydrogenase accessory sulfurtransferase FdhD [Gemmatimonadota bacterium]